MTRLNELNFLRVVDRHSRRSEAAPKRRDEGALQLTLFPRDEEHLVTTFVLDLYSRDILNSVVSYVFPAIVFDIRVSPRFDYKGLSRNAVFELFHQTRASYFDLSGELGVTNRLDARLNPVFVGEKARDKLRASQRAVMNVMFFIDRADDNPEYVRNLVHGLSPDHDDWSWMRVGAANQ